MTSRLTFIVSTALVAAGVSAVSIAQEGGPFARPIPKDVSDAMPSSRTATSPAAPSSAYRPPAPQPYQYTPPVSAPASPYTSGNAVDYVSPPYEAPPSYAPAPSSSVAPAGAYYPPAQTSNTGYYSDPQLAGPTSPDYGSINYGGVQTPSSAPQYRSGAAFTDPNYVPGTYDNTPYQGGAYAPTESIYANTSGPNNSGPMGNPQPWPQTGPQTGQAPSGQPQGKKSIWQRLGFGGLKWTNSGYLRLGDAVVSGGDNTRNELIADASIRSEISAVTQGGLEYGFSAKLRGQRDRYREGFGGLAGNCPPGFAGCASADASPGVAGGIRAVKGHTGQLYTSGPNQTREHKIALEGAHLFLRSGYGDITLGRDDGAAALFSLSAPSTLPLARASNARADYTGLDMTKTRNDASGFAEKITYTSPRLLGDQIGFGVQVGASYAPGTEVCGVDYCVRGHDRANVENPLTPSLKDAFELGLSVDRTFDSGLSTELVVNYATASESSGIVGFDNLQSYGLGLNIGYGDFSFGTNYLSSNNGIANDGDYSAIDLGLTWKPADWGVTFGLGSAKDDLAKTEGRSALLGVSYDINNYTFGTGVQYTQRDVPFINGAVIDERSEDATALFIEGGFKF